MSEIRPFEFLARDERGLGARPRRGEGRVAVGQGHGRQDIPQPQVVVGEAADEGVSGAGGVHRPDDAGRDQFLAPGRDPEASLAAQGDDDVPDAVAHQAAGRLARLLGARDRHAGDQLQLPGNIKRFCIHAKIQGMARRLSTPPFGLRLAGREPRGNLDSSCSGVALRK